LQQKYLNGNTIIGTLARLHDSVNNNNHNNNNNNNNNKI